MVSGRLGVGMSLSILSFSSDKARSFGGLGALGASGIRSITAFSLFFTLSMSSAVLLVSDVTFAVQL